MPSIIIGPSIKNSTVNYLQNNTESHYVCNNKNSLIKVLKKIQNEKIGLVVSHGNKDGTSNFKENVSFLPMIGKYGKKSFIVHSCHKEKILKNKLANLKIPKNSSIILVGNEKPLNQSYSSKLIVSQSNYTLKDIKTKTDLHQRYLIECFLEMITNPEFAVIECNILISNHKGEIVKHRNSYIDSKGKHAKISNEEINKNRVFNVRDLLSKLEKSKIIDEKYKQELEFYYLAHDFTVEETKESTDDPKTVFTDNQCNTYRNNLLPISIGDQKKQNIQACINYKSPKIDLCYELPDTINDSRSSLAAACGMKDFMFVTYFFNEKSTMISEKDQKKNMGLFAKICLDFDLNSVKTLIETFPNIVQLTSLIKLDLNSALTAIDAMVSQNIDFDKFKLIIDNGAEIHFDKKNDYSPTLDYAISAMNRLNSIVTKSHKVQKDTMNCAKLINFIWNEVQPKLNKKLELKDYIQEYLDYNNKKEKWGNKEQPQAIIKMYEQCMNIIDKESKSRIKPMNVKQITNISKKILLSKTKESFVDIINSNNTSERKP